jgi:hypothetical protein
VGLLNRILGRGETEERKGDEPPDAAGGPSCEKCGRALKPGLASCPFCNPQVVKADLGSTVQMGFKPQRGVVSMSGVMAATQLAQQYGAKGFLHVYEGERKGQSVLLGSRPVTIGRTEENVIVLADAGASSRHAEIRPTGDQGFVIADLQSRNGTFVNDHRIREKKLVNGDLVLCGATRLYVGLL